MRNYTVPKISIKLSMTSNYYCTQFPQNSQSVLIMNISIGQEDSTCLYYVP